MIELTYEEKLGLLTRTLFSASLQSGNSYNAVLLVQRQPILFEERADACFGLDFAASLPVLIQEFCTDFESWVTGSPVPAEVCSLSSWIRAFSVKSLTNLLRPLEILIHQ